MPAARGLQTGWTDASLVQAESQCGSEFRWMDQTAHDSPPTPSPDRTNQTLFMELAQTPDRTKPACFLVDFNNWSCCCFGPTPRPSCCPDPHMNERAPLHSAAEADFPTLLLFFASTNTTFHIDLTPAPWARAMAAVPCFSLRPPSPARLSIPPRRSRTGRGPAS
jgi:hypothetical protein